MGPQTKELPCRFATVHHRHYGVDLLARALVLAASSKSQAERSLWIHSGAGPLLRVNFTTAELRTGKDSVLDVLNPSRSPDALQSHFAKEIQGVLIADR